MLLQTIPPDVEMLPAASGPHVMDPLVPNPLVLVILEHVIALLTSSIPPTPTLTLNTAAVVSMSISPFVVWRPADLIFEVASMAPFTPKPSSLKTTTSAPDKFVTERGVRRSTVLLAPEVKGKKLKILPAFPAGADAIDSKVDGKIDSRPSTNVKPVSTSKLSIFPAMAVFNVAT
jgi:hypothetical protein